ncbi:MAG: SCO family protein [Opitutales bacterium]
MKLTSVPLAMCFLWTAGFCADPSLTSEDLAAVRFEQKLNDRLPLQLTFYEAGEGDARLGDLLENKPALLVLGYNNCPMLCGLVLNGMIDALQEIKLTAGKDFSLISVSIDPLEEAGLAAARKALYVKRYGRRGAAGGWHFLTGEEEAIQQLADAVGFGFAYDPATGEYAHPNGFMLVTPDGRISRYFFGVDFRPDELDDALREASGGEVGSPIRQLLMICFQYNPLTGKYGSIILITLRVAGVLTFLVLIGYIARSIARERAGSSIPGESKGGGAR